jgi:phosphate transport system protein
VHARHAAVFPELVALMASNPGAIERAARLQSIAKYLERIADHSANIAEMVVFMVSGADVRHSRFLRAAPSVLAPSAAGSFRIAS